MHADIDECAVGTSGCDVNAYCTNTILVGITVPAILDLLELGELVLQVCMILSSVECVFK